MSISAKSTFASLPTEIQKWWVELPAELKGEDFKDWMSLSNDQWIAIYEICLGRYKKITLCGAAGNGKSYVSKFSKRILEAQNKEVLMVASTGIAAYLSGGITINSALSMGAEQDILPMGLSDKIHHSSKPVRKNKSGKVEYQIQTRRSIEAVLRKVVANGLINKDKKSELIIFFDEVGMFSSENLVIAIQIVKQLFVQTKRPVRFVFLADYRQLLPINKPSETPWEVNSNLAIHPAQFETMRFHNTDNEVVYNKDKHEIKSMLGVVNTDGKISVEDGIALSLITNHRQGENKKFINDLNAVGDGTGCFNLHNKGFVSSIAERIFLVDRDETYNWLESKKRKELLADPETLKKAVHVYYSNRAVSEANTIGTEQAISLLKTKFGMGYGHYSRDYQIDITISKGEGSDTVNRVLQDISPIGVTTLSTNHPSYLHESKLHKNVPSILNKDIHTYGYQRICVGMRWMCRMNLNAKLRNGTVCTVVFVSDEYFNVIVDNDSTKEHQRIEAKTELFVKRNGKGIPIAKVYGIPGHPAYALTYHKTQGITVPAGNPFVLHIDSVMVSLAKRSNMHGLLYVGLSRVATLEQLYIIYEANVLIEDGMNAMCKTNSSVFEFIKYTETQMHSYINKEHVFNLPTEVKPEPVEKPVVKEENKIEALKFAVSDDDDVFNCETSVYRPDKTIKRMTLLV